MWSPCILVLVCYVHNNTLPIFPPQAEPSNWTERLTDSPSPQRLASHGWHPPRFPALKDGRTEKRGSIVAAFAAPFTLQAKDAAPTAVAAAS